MISLQVLLDFYALNNHNNNECLILFLGAGLGNAVIGHSSSLTHADL